MAGAGTIELGRHRFPWTDIDERFLVRAKRERFCHRDIAHVLQRTAQSVDMKVKRLEDSGVLLKHRKEELALLRRLLAEERSREVHGDEG